MFQNFLNKSIFLVAFVLGLSARAGEITVISDSENGEKMVVFTEQLNDLNQRVLVGWTAVENSHQGIDWNKIEAGDEKYLSDFDQKISRGDVYISTVLVDKYLPSVIARPDVDRPCAFTGTSGFNFNCNHYGDELNFDLDQGTMSFLVFGKWSLRHAFVYFIEINSTTEALEAVAYSDDLLQSIEDRMIQVLDEKHAEKPEYAEQRDLLLPWVDDFRVEKDASGALLNFRFTALIPKVDDLYMDATTLKLYTPTGKGHLRCRLQ